MYDTIVHKMKTYKVSGEKTDKQTPATMQVSKQQQLAAVTWTRQQQQTTVKNCTLHTQSKRANIYTDLKTL